MLKQAIKRGGLRIARATGLTSLVQHSRWRRDRLIIWCFHGVSTADEHLWRPALFLEPSVFERRLRFIREQGLEVVELNDGLRRLQEGSLRGPSVALTFDDGFDDFYSLAAPSLERFGMPATVYWTTYYALRPWPVFGLICSYLAWKRRDRLDAAWNFIAEQGGSLQGRPEDSDAVAAAVVKLADAKGLSGTERNDLAALFAERLDFDWDEIVASRLLQIMTPEQAGDLSSRGFDVQLHTHRHRTPDDGELYRREIEENRQIIEEATGNRANHYCYPSGVWHRAALPWLVDLGVVSATTCEHGIVSPSTDLLLAPRYVDRSSLSDDEAVAWLSGFFALVHDRG